MQLSGVPVVMDQSLLPNAVKFQATNGHEIVLVDGVEAIDYSYCDIFQSSGCL